MLYSSTLGAVGCGVIGWRNSSYNAQLCRASPLDRSVSAAFMTCQGRQISMVLNEDFEEDGAIVYREACRLGCKGIVSKRIGSLYRSGRSAHWVKVKNPNAPAVKREAEEDWGSPRYIKSRKQRAVTRGEY
jgi:hypothetical protein